MRKDFLYFFPFLYDNQDFIEKLVRPKLHPVTNQTSDDFLFDIYKWALESVTYLALDTRMGCLTLNLPSDSDPMQMIKATDRSATPKQSYSFTFAR